MIASKRNWLLIFLIGYILCGLYLLTATYYFVQTADPFHFSIPLIYFSLTLVAAIYLERTKKNRLLPLLILFLLTVSLSYISASPASFGDAFAIVIFSTSSMLCISFLVHFLRDYYKLIDVKWPYTNKLSFMYSFPILIFPISMLVVVSPSFQPIVNWGTLLFFANGLLNISYILLHGYFQSKKLQIKILIASCIVPFLPYVLLYIAPKIVLQPPLLSAEIASVFFILIPFSFISTQLTERLFGLQYYVSRLRYFGIFAIIFGLLIGAFCAVIYEVVFEKFMLTWVISATIIYGLLIVKEKMDFKRRMLLPATASDTDQTLFTAIQQLGTARTQEQLFQSLKQQVVAKLAFEEVLVIRTEQMDSVLSIKKNGAIYSVPIHQNYILQIGSKGKGITLHYEEIIWIELVVLYCDAFAQSLKHIEDLARELEVQSDEIPWLQKLVWTYVEKEKSELSQELHDTILQELLYIARELDKGAAELPAIREQVLDVAYELREYCETLTPPLLNTVGLQAALEKLALKMKLRANFQVEQRLSISKIKEPIFSLMIYRVVQELYNNALKHSKATHVVIEITACEETFTIHYKDDGIGMKHSSTSSMGMSGMQQRVQAFNGTLQLLPTSKGLQIILSN